MGGLLRNNGCEVMNLDWSEIIQSTTDVLTLVIGLGCLIIYTRITNEKREQGAN